MPYVTKFIIHRHQPHVEVHQQGTVTQIRADNGTLVLETET